MPSNTTTDQPTLAVLKPCPFCGGDVRLDIGKNAFEDVEVSCLACGCQGPNYDDGFSRDDNSHLAITAWNTRTNSEPRPAKLEDVARMIALAGLGTTDGKHREPHGEWTLEDFQARILDIIPMQAMTRCLALAADILATGVSEPRPAGDLREAIRKAKLAADEVYGVDWHRLEEISRFELVQYRRDLAWKAGQKARRANKTLKSNNRQQGTIFYDDWCDGWQREDREMHMEAARG